MGSPGIDKWIEKAPESWAKLAKNASKQNSFQEFITKFYEGAKLENKEYLEKYLTQEQLQHIYEKGLGGTIQKGDHVIQTPIQPTKTKIIQVTRKGKIYSRTSNPRWSKHLNFVIGLAAKEKPKSQEYERLINVLVAQGRTRQAAVKKVQRTRKEAKK